MAQERKLITEVQMYPVLFKLQNVDYNLRKELWEKIAKRCGITNGFDACTMWLKLIKSYMGYLRYGHDFEFIKEMRFMQSYLISVQSDSDDLDEDELQRILDSDSETFCSNSTPAKRQKKIKTKTQINKKRIQVSPLKTTPKTEKVQVTSNPTVDSSSVTTTEYPTSTGISTNVSSLSSLQLIFLGYAKVLSEMPLQIQIQTKHKIAQIMNEAERSLLKTNDSNKHSD